MAIVDPEAATALGANLVVCWNTCWFERKASTVLISATNTVESPAIAIDLGWDAVGTDAGLRKQSRVNASKINYQKAQTRILVRLHQSREHDRRIRRRRSFLA